MVYKVHYYDRSIGRNRIERKNYKTEAEAMAKAKKRQDSGQYAGYFARPK